MKSHLNATWLWLHSKRHRTYLNTAWIEARISQAMSNFHESLDIFSANRCSMARDITFLLHPEAYKITLRSVYS